VPGPDGEKSKGILREAEDHGTKVIKHQHTEDDDE